VQIFGLEIKESNYELLLSAIGEAIIKRDRIALTYANQHILNNVYKEAGLRDLYGKFDIVHADGIGVYFASKFLYGKGGLKVRITGSDLYEQIIPRALNERWRIYFFGDTDETLEGISKKIPGLKIAGINNGYQFKDEEIIRKINDSGADIVIVGMGSPKQEHWIIRHKDYLAAPVIIAVGDGIKVFAGNKKRGPVWIRKTGFEWAARLTAEPLRMWRRYLIGIPLFFLRVFLFKVIRS